VSGEPRPGWKNLLQGTARVLRAPIYLLALVTITVMAVLPQFFGTQYFALSLVFATIYITLALAWDLSSGLTGYISFGLPFFFGLGAMATGYSYYHGVGGSFSLLAIDFGVGLLGGLLFALPTLRLRGPFFTLLSLLLPLIAASFVVAFWQVLHMPTIGYIGIPFLAPSPQAELPILSVTTAAVLTVSFLLRRSHFGLVLRAIRDDEDAVESKGIRTFPYKVAVFSFASGIAAFAGGTYAMTTSFGGIDSFDFQFLIYPMLIAIVGAAIVRGGLGGIVGSVFAGYAIILFSQYLTLPEFNLQELTLPIFTFVAILLVLFLPSALGRPSGPREAS
jgi:branched-chain amino acid transport system permease protein